MATALIIPALSPDERLLDLIGAVREGNPRLPVVIVDDGSSPALAELFERLRFYWGCALCRHPEPYGKGAAIKTGIGYAARHYPGCTGFLVADGQHLPAEVLGAAAAMEEHPGHLVLGVRGASQGESPPKRRWSDRILSAGLRGTAGGELGGVPAGLLGIPAQYEGLALETPGEGFAYETRFLLRAAGEKVPLLPIFLKSGTANGRQSPRFRPVGDSLRIYGAILRHYTGALLRRRRKGQSKEAASPQGKAAEETPVMQEL